MTSTGGRLFSKAKAKTFKILTMNVQVGKLRGGAISDLETKNYAE